jgi:hypothetical protein
VSTLTESKLLSPVILYRVMYERDTNVGHEIICQFIELSLLYFSPKPLPCFRGRAAHLMTDHEKKGKGCMMLRNQGRRGSYPDDGKERKYGKQELFLFSSYFLWNKFVSRFDSRSLALGSNVAGRRAGFARHQARRLLRQMVY